MVLIKSDHIFTSRSELQNVPQMVQEDELYPILTFVGLYQFVYETDHSFVT